MAGKRIRIGRLDTAGGIAYEHGKILKKLGTPTAVTTRGGVIFIGGAAEHSFRALDTATGEELWSSRLSTSANATTITYRSPVSGRQFVVVAEGGRPHYGTKPGTKLVAFALHSTEK
jgi:quinoprotein glucose dehydrogenase